VRRSLQLAFAVLGLWLCQGAATAQTVVIGIREPSVGNPASTARVTLNILDAGGRTLATFFPTAGVYNFTMPAIANSDKRVTLQFQRVAGTTSLSVAGVNGAATGTQRFDLIIP